MAILRPGGKVVVKPFDVPHLSTNFQSLEKLIRELDGETRIVMECTGHYYELVARDYPRPAFFVALRTLRSSVAFGAGQSLSRQSPKTDGSSVKIARYTLDSWANLKQYSLMDGITFPNSKP